jgi:uncharacterized membrane protein YeaQ/YmgE (transglycosylase-associated protein family)
MALLLTLILGGLAGWIASMILNRNDGMGVLLNIVVGVVGAWLANWLLAPLFGIEAKLDELSLGGFLMSVLGAGLLLLVVNLITKGRARA